MQATMQAWNTPTLTGRHVQLEPLRAEHAEALQAAVADGELWSLRYTNVPGPGLDDVVGYVESALAARDAGQMLPFVVRDASGAIVGTTRFYDIDRSVPRAKLGYTWYAQRVQRTGLNTEAKRLLIEHAFAEWGCEVVVLETSHANLRSQAAILRLGAQRDGVLRASVRHRDGTLRDTHVFSILRDEWPALRRALDQKLQEHAA